MCRYWSDPQVLSKLSAVMGDTFDPAAMQAAAEGAGDGEAEEDEMDVHAAASAGEPVASTTMHDYTLFFVINVQILPIAHWRPFIMHLTLHTASWWCMS